MIAALLFALALPAQGAALTVTYRDANCAEFKMTGSGGNFTVECASDVPPVTPIPPVTPPTGPIACPNFPDGTAVVDLPWEDASKAPIVFRGYGALVLRFTVPPGTPTSNVNTPGTIRINEYQGPPTQRFAVLSTAPCDFTGRYGSAIPALSTGTGVSFVTSVQAGRVTLVPGQTYYINLRNTNTTGGWSCFQASCNIIANWFIPRASTAAAAKSKSKR